MKEPTQPEGELGEGALDELVRAAFEARRPASPGSTSSLFESLGGLEEIDLRLRLTAPRVEMQPVDADSPELPPEADERSRYEIAGEVARGGIGVVLRAHDHELGRDVAMKLLRRDRAHDSRALRRFLEEAQIGAQLEHPAIVPVHDVGVSGDGRPFFTMQLVEGRTLREVLDLVRESKEGWSTTRALGVLVRVCEAVAYAHQRRVVHRDLKPGNVLVGTNGEVYVTDWGLARLPDRSPAGESRAEVEPRSSLATHEGEVLGTPAYMPPEQAEGQRDLGPEADVYAVGAMLYHLLAGHAPYSERATKASSEETLRALRAGPPAALGRQRPAPPELIAICERAMARAATGRYADMDALRGDLQAFLEDRVVGAYRTGALAELRKWTARNLGLACSVASLLLVLVGGSVGIALREASNARRERELGEDLARETRAALEASLAAKAAADAAVEDAERARRERIAADRVAGFLEELFGASDPDRAQGTEPTARELLARGASRIRYELGEDPLLRARLALAMGKAYRSLSAYEEAEELLREAYALTTEHLGEDHPDTLTALDQLAEVPALAGRFEEAERLFLECLERRRRVLGEDHPDTLLSLNNEGYVHGILGRYREAEAVLADCLERCQRLLEPGHSTTLYALANLAWIYQTTRRDDLAEELFHEEIEIRKQAQGDDHPQTMLAVQNLGSVYFNQGRLEEAEELFLWSLERMERVLGEVHVSTLICRSNLVDIYLRRGEIERARSIREEMVAAALARHGPRHPSTLLLQGRLAGLHYDLEDFERAEALFRELLPVEVEVLGEHHDETLGTLNNLGGCLRELGRTAEAESFFLRALEGVQAIHPPTNVNRLTVEFNVARFYAEQGRFEEAEPLARSVVEWTPPDHPERANRERLLERAEARLEVR